MSSTKPAREDGAALSRMQMRRACRAMLVVLTVLALAAAVPAFQVPAGGLAAWPPAWHVVRDAERGVPAFVYGSHRPLVPASAVTDAALERAARGLVDELSRDLGYDAAGLQLVRVKHLALSRFGSSDKIAVCFAQVTDGVPTQDGSVAVLFSADGELLALDNRALPGVRRTPLAPEWTEAAAASFAAAQFVADTGEPAARVEFAEYVLYPERPSPSARVVRAAPAFSFRVLAPAVRGGGALPVARQYVIAARGSLRVLHSESLVHTLGDAVGTVSGLGQVGLFPDGSDPAVEHPLKDVRIEANGLVAFTDDAGHFTLPGVAPGDPVTASLEGQWSHVLNGAGPDSILTQAFDPAAPLAFVFNAAPSQFTTAEVNAQTAIEHMRDWVRGIDPSETLLDGQLPALVNDAAFGCNALYEAGQVNFAAVTGSCPNMAYSTIVWHEEGHWANELFGSQNGPDGFGEGAADAWSMYVSGDPVVGIGFFGPGTILRTGENTLQFCGDGSFGCHGEEHENGEVLMGALWKVRKHLTLDFGDEPGAGIANGLFLGWFQAFNDGAINSIIEQHWLALDDDDGDMGNLTPHYAAINAGFHDQGFPGVSPFKITTTPLTVVNHESPVPVEADVVELDAAVPVAAVRLHYRFTAGGPFTVQPMAHVGGESGHTWAGHLPGVASPAIGQYYIEAVDASGSAATSPPQAPSHVHSYDIGNLQILSAWDFEADTDEGWTHSGANDDWQRGSPGAQSAPDPSLAFSGTRVWGNNLALDGSTGAYAKDSASVLSSPSVDLTAASHVRLRFRRWLSADFGVFDTAQVLVNGAAIDSNYFDAPMADTEWVAKDYDIAALADGRATTVSFALTTDGTTEAGGWNIDDVQLVSLGPVTPGAFTEFGSGLAGSGGHAPHLSGTGDLHPGGAVTLHVFRGKPGAMGIVFLGGTEASIPVHAGTFLVGDLFAQTPLLLDAAGEAKFPDALGSAPAPAGLHVVAQFWCPDRAAAGGFAASNGLQFTIQ